jgi:ribosomal-protein-alanine N-acetyltransferase
MAFRFVPMTIDYAVQSARWVYGGLDEVYGHDPENPHDLAELDPAGWVNQVFAALDETDGYAGIFQMEESEGLLTIEAYLRPDLTGRGLGESFVRAGIAFALSECGYRTTHARLWVNAFNRRAIKVYERIGFRITGERQAASSGPVEHRLLGAVYPQYEMRISLGDLAAVD